MLTKTLIFLYLGVVVCFSSDVGESKACGDYTLGPPEELTLNVGKLLDISWKPPLFYENCLVEYKLYIQNMNTSEYLTNVQSLTGLNYTFDYGLYDHVCIHIRVRVYSAYNGTEGTNPAMALNYLDPLVPFTAPNTLNIQNTEKTLVIQWTTPKGYEKCYYYFMFDVRIYVLTGGNTIAQRYIAGYEYHYDYTDDHTYYCEEVVVHVRGHYRGNSGLQIQKTMIFGPPGYC